MHDIDRTQQESEAFESENFEFSFEGESNGESPFSQEEEMEFATELLSVTTEGELDQFLGNLIKRGAKAVGGFIKSPTGQALGGILKGAAKKALPILGKAAGGWLGGSTGADIGGKLATCAGKAFGLELEGLSNEDQEFEVAKQFVRLAGEASKNAAKSPSTTPSATAARDAFVSAAQQHAPGLLGATASSGGVRARQQGRWIRRGRSIVLLGV